MTKGQGGLVVIRRNKITGVLNLDVEVADRQDLAKRYLSEAPFGGLVVDCDQDWIEEEALVELNIHLLSSGETHRLRGVVLWCRKNADNPCAGIGFLPIDTIRREQLLSQSKMENREQWNKNELLRQSSRYDAPRWKVSYQSSSEACSNSTDSVHNISSEGIYVKSAYPPMVGARFLFKLYPPFGGDPVYMPGKVTWRNAGVGFGVRFADQQSMSRDRFERLLHKVAANSIRHHHQELLERVSP